MAALQALGNPLTEWNWRYPSPRGESLSDIAFGHGKFVAVGAAGTILTSTNGTNWVDRSLSTNVDLTAVMSGPDGFIVVGGSLAFRSSDGENWSSAQRLPIGPLVDITYGNQRYLVGGADGQVATSIDGLNWQAQRGLCCYLNEIAFGNGIFLSVGPYYGTGGISSDGRTWTPHYLYFDDALGNVSFVKDKFFVGGRNSIRSSSNGIDWAFQSLLGEYFETRAFAYGSAGYVGIGGRG